MKRIVCAWIDEVLRFDTQAEADDFIRKLERGHRRHKIESVDAQEDGSVRVRVKRQYNNATFSE